MVRLSPLRSPQLFFIMKKNKSGHMPETPPPHTHTNPGEMVGMAKEEGGAWW